jgi:uncharacterized membrane protein
MTDVPLPEGSGVGERRWPVALTILVAIVLLLLMPDRLTLGAGWIFPVVVGVLLVAVSVADPGRIDRRSTTVRVLSIGTLLLLIVAVGWATERLIAELIQGGGVTNSAGELLRTGAVVWVENGIVFSLLYWELDSEGPASRLYRTRRYPDFAFPPHMNPALAPPGWRPLFGDYLYLGYTNAVAFSPTDVMPLAHWAKAAMLIQSMISILILSLVIARAVNIFQ